MHLGLFFRVVSTRHVVGFVREERRQLMKLLALPTVERVIVTLGALNVDPHEEPGGLRGDLLRLVLKREGKVVRTVVLRPVVGSLLRLLGRGGDQLADDPVPAGVLLELLREPVFQRLRVELLLLGRSVVQHDGAPVVPPVLRVLGRFEQPVDEFAALLGVGVGDELFDRVRFREPARQIERDSPQKALIADDRSVGLVLGSNPLLQILVEVFRGEDETSADSGRGERLVNLFEHRELVARLAQTVRVVGLLLLRGLSLRPLRLAILGKHQRHARNEERAGKQDQDQQTRNTVHSIASTRRDNWPDSMRQQHNERDSRSVTRP